MRVGEIEDLRNTWFAAFAVAYTTIVYKCGGMSDDEASKKLSEMHDEMQVFARKRRAEMAVDKVLAQATEVIEKEKRDNPDGFAPPKNVPPFDTN